MANMTGADMTTRSHRTVHLRPRQIAEQHGVSERTVRRWIAEGRVDSVRVGRSVFVTVESVERLFEGGDR